VAPGQSLGWTRFRLSEAGAAKSHSHGPNGLLAQGAKPRLCQSEGNVIFAATDGRTQSELLPRGRAPGEREEWKSHV